MEVHDRSPIAEELISQLWEQNYFSALELTTDAGQPLKIISLGQKNFDSGPDFKDIVIKIEDKIFNGDLEIHRSANDWYLHKHHHDSAYNNVILHLVIGKKIADKSIIRLNQQPVLAQVFVDIPNNQISYLTNKYQLSASRNDKIKCKILNRNLLSIIEHAGVTRFKLKAERFKEGRQNYSWNQIIYMGIMEALGYSKNQRPFQKISQLLPIEFMFRELQNQQDDSLVKIQALLFGVAGLLPSQDPKLLIKDADSIEYLSEIEQTWEKIKSRIGVTPMKKEEWHFFRLRPTNFPTRRLAGAGYIWARFVKLGLLETFLKIQNGLSSSPDQIIDELEKLFICTAEGYWANHYVLGEVGVLGRQPTLIGQSRARDITVNIVLPSILSYAEECENGRLTTTVLQVYRQYPKSASNQITRYMTKLLLGNEKKSINTTLKQQGLIHLHKMYCKNKECERCVKHCIDNH